MEKFWCLELLNNKTYPLVWQLTSWDNTLLCIAWNIGHEDLLLLHMIDLLGMPISIDDQVIHLWFVHGEIIACATYFTYQLNCKGLLFISFAILVYTNWIANASLKWIIQNSCFCRFDILLKIKVLSCWQNNILLGSIVYII